MASSLQGAIDKVPEKLTRGRLPACHRHIMRQPVSDVEGQLLRTGLYTFDRYQPEISRKTRRIAVYGTQHAGSLGSSGSLWEDAHIVSRYQPVPNNPKIALITLSTTERPLNIDQAKSANAQSENTSTMPLLLKLPPGFCFVSCTSRRLCTQSTVVNRR
jgi:hypothetical protein